MVSLQRMVLGWAESTLLRPAPRNFQSEFPEVTAYNETNDRDLRQKENTIRNSTPWHKHEKRHQDGLERRYSLRLVDWCLQRRR